MSATEQKIQIRLDPSGVPDVHIYFRPDASAPMTAILVLDATGFESMDELGGTLKDLANSLLAQTRHADIGPGRPTFNPQPIMRNPRDDKK